MNFRTGLLLFFTSLNLAIADDGKKANCTDLFREAGITVINPFHPISLGIDYLKKFRKLTFDIKKYNDTFFFFSESIETGKPLELAERLQTPKDAETFMALLDLRFERSMHPTSDILERYQSNPVATENWIRALNFQLARGTFTDNDLRRLSRMLYALSRRIPLDHIEFFLNPPTQHMADLIDYQVNRLFLQDVLKKVFLQMGLKETAVSRPLLKAIVHYSVRGLGTLLAYTNETMIIKTALTDDFIRKIETEGYDKAMREFVPNAKDKTKFEKEIRGTLRWERAIQVLGALISGGITVRFVYCLLPNAKVSPEKMIDLIMDQWADQQIEGLGYKPNETDKQYQRNRRGHEKTFLEHPEQIEELYNEIKKCTQVADFIPFLNQNKE